MVASAWLIGSYENLPAQSITLVHSAVSDTVSVATGSYYLEDGTASLSALNALETALETHTSAPSYTVSLLENRLVQIAADAGTFTLTWTDTELRDMLGFTGNLTPAAASFTATLVSDYLWAPGKTESPLESILGVEGRRVKDTRYGMSGLAGRVVTTNNDTRVQNRFVWNNVTPSYYWTASELGGEWQSFWDTVVSPGLRFKMYRNTTLDTTSSSVVTLGTELGPYKYRPQDGVVQFDPDRAEEYLDNNFRVDLPVTVVAEYS